MRLGIWFFFTGVYVSFSFIGALLDTAVGGLDLSLTASLLGFSPESVGGWGFFGIAATIVTTTIPKWASFDYVVLSGADMNWLRWILITTFGGGFILAIAWTFGLALLGGRR